LPVASWLQYSTRTAALHQVPGRFAKLCQASVTIHHLEIRDTIYWAISEDSFERSLSLQFLQTSKILTQTSRILIIFYGGWCQGLLEMRNLIIDPYIYAQKCGYQHVVDVMQAVLSLLKTKWLVLWSHPVKLWCYDDTLGYMKMGCCQSCQ